MTSTTPTMADTARRAKLNAPMVRPNAKPRSRQTTTMAMTMPSVPAEQMLFQNAVQPVAAMSVMLMRHRYAGTHSGWI